MPFLMAEMLALLPAGPIVYLFGMQRSVHTRIRWILVTGFRSKALLYQRRAARRAASAHFGIVAALGMAAAHRALRSIALQ